MSDTYGNKFRDDEFSKIIEGEDIFALTEKHIQVGTVISIPGYVVKTHIPSKRAKRYSGTITLAKKHDSSTSSNVKISNSKSDNILWARLKCSAKGERSSSWYCIYQPLTHLTLKILFSINLKHGISL